MADFYTQLSFEVLGSPEECDRLITLLELAEEPTEFDEATVLGAEYELTNNGVWIHDGAGWVEVDALCELLSDWLKETGASKSIGIEWANTCSKPRLDAFGGGAAVVRASGVTYCTTGQWLAEETGA